MENYKYYQLLIDLKDKKFICPEDAQTYLYSANISIIEAIKLTRNGFGISLGEAKQIVAGHIVWSKEAKVGEEFHESIIHELES